MIFSKNYSNGLKIVLNRIEGLLSVSCGVLVNTGSSNENEQTNGISHFIEHNMFKGTNKRTAFEISEDIDNIGAQINAFTSKDITCYYTKSTAEHLEDCLEVLSDIFFNSKYEEKELEKEKGVILEEINMSLDTPDDVCLDLLAKAHFGDTGYGRTILGEAKNVKSFTRDDVLTYLNRYYTADNVCISIAGNIDIDKTVKLIDEYFANNFNTKKADKQFKDNTLKFDKLNKYKKIEQSHMAICLPGYKINHENSIPLSIVNTVFGGSMSSRLFQIIREELGLAYTVYSYISSYKSVGVVEIYSGVNNDKREQAYNAIKNQIELLGEKGITQKEFKRGVEQMKSAFVLGQESSSSQMLISGKTKLLLNEEFSFEDRINKINAVTLEQANAVCKKIFSLKNYSASFVGPFKKIIK